MRITQDSEGRWEERWVEASIEGVEPLVDRRYGSETRPMQPDRLRVIWQRTALTPTWAVSKVIIAGRNAKQDGSLGARRTFTYYSGRDMPAWAHEWVAAHTPGEE